MPRAWAARGLQSSVSPGRAERDQLEAMRQQQVQQRIGRALPGERHDQAAADRDPDRLAVERIAGGEVEQHGIGAERRGIAEDAADIVVIGDAERHHHQRLVGQAGEQRLGCDLLAAQPDAEQAAMDVEAGDAVEDRLAGGVDRQFHRRLRQ